jgi:hypothetical protein
MELLITIMNIINKFWNIIIKIKMQLYILNLRQLNCIIHMNLNLIPVGSYSI